MWLFFNWIKFKLENNIYVRSQILLVSFYSRFVLNLDTKKINSTINIPITINQDITRHGIMHSWNNTGKDHNYLVSIVAEIDLLLFAGVATFN